MAVRSRKALPSNIDGWLAYIQTIHSRSIDLTLERVRRVAHCMKLAPAVPVMTVAGTNGKGSVVESLPAGTDRARVIGGLVYLTASGALQRAHLLEWAGG